MPEHLTLTLTLTCFRTRKAQSSSQKKLTLKKCFVMGEKETATLLSFQISVLQPLKCQLKFCAKRQIETPTFDGP